jgi:hypothetical protein
MLHPCGDGRPAFFPEIDYRSHPAFAHIDQQRYSDDAGVEARVGAIDRAFSELTSRAWESEDQCATQFDKTIRPLLADLESHLAETIPSKRINEWISRSLAHADADLLAQALIAQRRRGWQGQDNDLSRDLKEQGFHLCRLDTQTRSRLLDLCAPAMERLRNQGKGTVKGRLVENFELESDVGRTLHKFFAKQGVLDGLSAYAGSNVNFVGFTLEYSYPGQRWWKGAYADCGLPEARTSYMHFDQGCRDPKAIVALSEIGPENGPTGFVRGSHLEPRSPFLHFLMTGLDLTFQADPKMTPEGLNYRPRFSHEAYRREMLALPTCMHGSSHFGDDIVDGSQLSEKLLANEVKMTRDKGDCIVFDGNFGIHRGGLVQQGERFVFQVVFDIAPRHSALELAKRKARGMALRMLGKA